jgi:hypothetical protein
MTGVYRRPYVKYIFPLVRAVDPNDLPYPLKLYQYSTGTGFVNGFVSHSSLFSSPSLGRERRERSYRITPNQVNVFLKGINSYK